MITCPFNLHKLESLYDQLARQKWAVVDGLLCDESLEFVGKALQESLNSGKLQPAKIGSTPTGAKPFANSQIRGDETLWIDNNAAGFQFLSELLSSLNSNLFLGIQHWEAHFAHYQSGAFYKTHWDVPPKSKMGSEKSRGRVLTFLFYLNFDWKADDGGELVIYSEDEKTELTRVQPQFGRSVFFLSSEFPHEVLPAKRSRLSLSGWFRDDR